jgi:tetratricopeptide (TPR) repeat protein
MLSANEELDDINRVHDDDPERAADRLRVLDVNALASDKLALAAFLVTHVLGEKLGDWNDAAAHMDRLCDRVEIPQAVLVHAAVADELAGRDTSKARAILLSEAPEAVVTCTVGLRCLTFNQERVETIAFAAQLLNLANCTMALPLDTGLDVPLAAGLNNATSRLLDIHPDVKDPVVREALRVGAAQALRIWQRAGTWINHERALYLSTLVANRLGEYAHARDAAREALEVIATNGIEDVDRAFLLLQLAGALHKLGDVEGSRSARRDANSIALSWTEAGLTTWFADEESLLFGSPSK